MIRGCVRDTLLDFKKCELTIILDFLSQSCVLKNNNYRTVHWHIRPQYDHEQGINKLRPYGCLIWHFSFNKPKNKMEKNHERSLKFLLHNWKLWLLKQLCRTSSKIHININGDRKTSHDSLWNFQNTKQNKSSFYGRYHKYPNLMRIKK